MLWKSNSNRFAFFYHKCDLCDWFQLGVESENSIGKAKKLDPSAEYIDAINELKGSIKKNLKMSGMSAATMTTRQGKPYKSFSIYMRQNMGPFMNRSPI